jgi:hypothetical protein
VLFSDDVNNLDGTLRLHDGDIDQERKDLPRENWISLSVYYKFTGRLIRPTSWELIEALINLLAPEFYIFILAHSICKM